MDFQISIEKPGIRRVSVEDKLLQIGKPLLNALCLAGYHPLLKAKWGKAGFVRPGIALFWAIFNFVLLLVTEVLYCIYIYSAIIEKQDMGFTENFAYSLMTYSVLTSFVVLKGLTIYKYKQNGKFWEQNVHLLEEFSEAGPQFDVSSEQQNDYFGRMGHEIRRSLIFGTIYIIYCMTVGVIRNKMVEDSFNALPGAYDFLIYTDSIVWNLNFSMYFLFGLFLGFYLKIYIACLRVIAMEVEKLVIIQNAKDKLTLVQNLDLGRTPILKPQYNREQMAEQLEQCLKAYLITEDLVLCFSRHFDTELFLIFVSSFFIIFARTFVILYAFLRCSPAELMFMVGKIVVYIWQIYYIAALCSQLDQEVKGIQFFLHRIELRDLPTYLQTKIQMLGVRLATEPHGISPREFFKLDRRLVTT
ncbi:unnamed protein product, partial [Allacma fusca]